MKPLVSVLIPAYNAERWISPAIDSALGQTWPHVEVIVVNDGSRDDTYEVARRHAGPRVNVVTQDNRGAAATRNRALQLAQGDYIQWLDADDLLHRAKIEGQIRCLEQAGDEMILLSSEFAKFYYNPARAVIERTPLWQDLSPVDWLVEKFSYKMSGMNPAVWLVSRKLSEKAGPWDERLTLNDDGEYFCRVVAASSFVKFVPGSRSFYRHWSVGTLNRSNSWAACRSLLLSLQLCVQHLLKVEDSPRTRRAAVQTLQSRLHYFYPEKQEMLQELEELARTLGGQLHRPTFNWKDSLIERSLGWGAMRRARNSFRAVKLSMRYNSDRFISSFQRGAAD